MRQEVLEYIQSLDIGGFNVSNELPWSESGTELYVKNLKKIYVDIDQIQVDPQILTLDGTNINNEITIIRIFLANDAKQVPANYSDVVNELKTAKDIEAAQGFNRREFQVSTDIQADRLITTIELRFIKLT
jgi:hypothetical protein